MSISRIKGHSLEFKATSKPLAIMTALSNHRCFHRRSAKWSPKNGSRERASRTHTLLVMVYSTLFTTDGMAPTNGAFCVRHIPCLVFLVCFLRMWIPIYNRPRWRKYQSENTVPFSLLFLCNKHSSSCSFLLISVMNRLLK